MIYLASQSPRRRQLLQQIGVRFQAISCEIDETPLFDETAQDFVRRMAIGKARAGHALYPDHPVLGSDTVVVVDGRILGKPKDRDHAIAMLLQLAGREHRVLTGVALMAEQQHYRLSDSRVRFRDISTNEAAAYWDSGEPADKAGGYAVQGLGAVYIEYIAGSYSGIMGLPLYETAELMKEIGEPVWLGLEG